MFQPTQYYHTKMQLAKMELENKLLFGNNRRKKQKTGSAEIMERMRMLELTDEADDEYADEYADDRQEPEDSAEQQAQEMILDAQSEELQGEVYSEKKNKKKKDRKKKEEEQELELETVIETEKSEQPEQAAALGQTGRSEQVLSAEYLQNRMIWAEILGEPVSVKRRKKRVEQLYGNQGHAYRR